jgi:hypothetical protein
MSHPGNENETKRKKHCRSMNNSMRLSFDHSPNHWRSPKENSENEHGIVLTSNKAYQDLLDGTLTITACSVESHHRTERSKGTYTFFHRHVLKYRGQVVWSCETRNHVNPNRTWGVRSVCAIVPEHKLKVDLFPTHETRIYYLKDILSQAAHDAPLKGIPLHRDTHQ